MAFQSDAFQSDTFQNEGGATTVESSFAASATLLKVQTGSLASSSIARKAQSGTASAASALLRTVSGSASADAAFTSSGYHFFSADSILSATRSSAWTAASVLLRSASGSYGADSVARKTQSGSITAGMFVQPWFSADAWLSGPTLFTFSADATVKAPGVGSFTADSIRRRMVETVVRLIFPGYDSGAYTGIGGNANVLAGPLDVGANTSFSVVVEALSGGNLGFFGGPTSNLADATENTGWQDGTVGTHTFTTGATSRYVWIYSWGWDPSKTGSGYIPNYGGIKLDSLIVQYGRPGSKTADAWIGSFSSRLTHKRDDPIHYDTDYASIIQLSSQLGVYAEGADLCSVLKDLSARIVDLEGRSAQWL